MKKKQPWMQEGTRAMANGKPGVITSIQQNRIDNTDYVYYIFVQWDGQTFSNPHHPNDVTELLENSAQEMKAYSVELGFNVRVIAASRSQAGDKARAQIGKLPFDIYVDDISEDTDLPFSMVYDKEEVENV